MNPFAIKNNSTDAASIREAMPIDVTKDLKRLFHKSLNRIRTRRFQAYCVGMPKSGTHSIDGLLAKNYRSLHEPEFENTWNILLSYKQKKLDQSQLYQLLRARDRRLGLEFDSSNLNYYLLDFLLHEFPESKYILTIRDCQSWLASAINHRISRRAIVKQTEEKDIFRFGPHVFDYEDEEKILASYGLPSLPVLLSYWAQHNQTVLETVPKERLLVIRTNEISESAEPIAKFLGIPQSSLNHGRSHLFRQPKKENILAQIDPDYLFNIINQHCHHLMSQYFPEISLYPTFHQNP